MINTYYSKLESNMRLFLPLFLSLFFISNFASAKVLLQCSLDKSTKVDVEILLDGTSATYKADGVDYEGGLIGDSGRFSQFDFMPKGSEMNNLADDENVVMMLVPDDLLSGIALSAQVVLGNVEYSCQYKLTAANRN